MEHAAKRAKRLININFDEVVFHLPISRSKWNALWNINRPTFRKLLISLIAIPRSRMSSLALLAFGWNSNFLKMHDYYDLNDFSKFKGLEGAHALNRLFSRQFRDSSCEFRVFELEPRN